MKNLILACVLVFVSQSAFAEDVWTVSSKGLNNSPISTEMLKARVVNSIQTYKKIDSNLGELRSFSCVVKKNTQLKSEAFVESCSALLDLPSDWCYYGSFKLDVGYEIYSNDTINSLKYEWVNQY
jgi:hypothetical protein